MLFSELVYDPENPIPWLESDDVERLYFKAEPSSMAGVAFAGDLLAKACHEKAGFLISNYAATEEFDPFVPFLAMNYFVRCTRITRNNVDNVDIVAVSCLLIAWKMRDLKFTIRRFLEKYPKLGNTLTASFVLMELRILRELDWSLRPILAPCYVPHYAPRLKTDHGIGLGTVREIMIYTQYDIWFTKFRPSTIAMSTLLAICDFLYSHHVVQLYIETISNPIFKETAREIEKCMEGIILQCHDLKLMMESAIPENASQPTLRIQAGKKHTEEEVAVWRPSERDIEIVISDDESEEEISLRRIRQEREEEREAKLAEEKANSEAQTQGAPLNEESKDIPDNPSGSSPKSDPEDSPGFPNSGQLLDKDRQSLESSERVSFLMLQRSEQDKVPEVEAAQEVEVAPEEGSGQVDQNEECAAPAERSPERICEIQTASEDEEGSGQEIEQVEDGGDRVPLINNNSESESEESVRPEQTRHSHGRCNCCCPL